jgi:hypothetical protein
MGYNPWQAGIPASHHHPSAMTTLMLLTEPHMQYVFNALHDRSGAEIRLLDQILAGDLLLCWTDPWIGLPPAGCPDNQTLCDSLTWLAEDNVSAGLQNTARDCFWLAAKVRSGTLQLVARDRAQAADAAHAAAFSAA